VSLPSVPFLALSLLLAAAPPARAGGSGENALLIVDPTRPESLYVANHYQEMRGIPDVNVLYMAPDAADYAQFVAANLPGFLGELREKRIGDHVDFVVLPSGGGFYLSAPGYVHDACAAVTRFAAPTPYTLAYRAADVLNGISSQVRNRFYKGSWVPQYFDSNLSWLGGDPSTSASARRYFIGAQLGYTGPNGNSLAEVLAMIDRSVAADATHPPGTFYFMETTDPLRSGPRDALYPQAVAHITAAGGSAQHLFDWLPQGSHDCLGIMTGFAAFDIDGADLTLLPGSFADHLTSYAGNFDDVSQTKMTRWIAKGASGTCGAVEEPCNYPGKFPTARMHALYFQGLSLGEAWFRSLDYEPFQDLFVGDPLTRPWAWPPSIDVPDAPGGTVSGTAWLTPVASATAPGADIDYLELHVDGVLHSTIENGELFEIDTTELDDGWHELRALAFDDTLVRNVGTWAGELVVDNDGLAVTLSAQSASGDLGTLFALDHAAAGDVVDEVQLVQNDRVVASSTGAVGTLGVHGQMLGAGTVRVQAVAVFAGGRRARSEPVTLSIAYSGGTTGTPPVAFGFTEGIHGTAVIELPATFDDPLASAVYTVVASPAKATILGGGTGPWRVVRPGPGAIGSDTLVFHVTTGAGTSPDATITIEYDRPRALLRRDSP